MSEITWAPFPQSSIVTFELPGKTIYTTADSPNPTIPTQAVMVLGAFDGLHLGHHALVQQARRDAARRKLPCVVVTFDPDPSAVVCSEVGPIDLLRVRDRCAGLLSWGVDFVVTFTFTNEFAALDPLSFYRKLTKEVATPASIHVGSNFRFGHLGMGDVELLRSFGAQDGFDVVEHELVTDAGVSISATRVRSLLASSKLSEANDLLGRCHYIRGHVEHGRGEGTAFGFPTANVVCELSDCLPAEGVYACYVIDGNLAWPAAANVGAPPSFSSARPAFLEANLIGFDGDLYDKEVVVSFVAWLRASRPFDSLEELERTVLGNIDWVRDNLGERPVEVRP